MKDTNVIKVNVTAKDIKAGEAAECYRCPVAIALQRATKDREARVVSVDWRLYLVVWCRYIAAPVEVRDFVIDFDHRSEDDSPPKPFRFTLPPLADEPWEEECYGCEELFSPNELDDEGYCKECATENAHA
jgi:hypothetical protein